MTQHDAFLHAIRESPDDDAPRLVFADWLEERDQPGDAQRAEFIRVQCALAGAHVAGAQHHDFVDRERQLLHEHAATWLAPLEGLANRFIFRRGFVEEVSISTQDLLQRGEVLFRQAPVRRLHLRGLTDIVRLLHTPARQRKFAELLCRISGLDLGFEYVTDDAGLALLTLPRLPRLTFLNLGRTPLTAAAARAILDSPLLDSVERLETESGSSGLWAVLESPRLAHLCDLALSNSRLGDDGVARLVALPLLAQLRALHLGHCNLSVHGVRTLGQCPAAGGLQTLGVCFNGLGPPGVRALVSSTSLACLTALNLQRTGLGDEGVTALAESRLFAQLSTCDLSLNRITDEGAYALAECSPEARPTVLDLIYNAIGPAARAALAARFGERACLFVR